MALTLEERVELLEKETEILRRSTAGLINDMRAQQLKGLVEQFLNENPDVREEVSRLLQEETEQPMPLPPDHLVPTVNGNIRAGEIPGYKNEPGWRPSIDWVEANCTCPTHTEKRNNQNPENGTGGLYL